MINNKRFALQEAAHCLLCEDAPCDDVCPKKASPSDFTRSIRFENIPEPIPCLDCDAPEAVPACEKACIHSDRPVRIRELAAFDALVTRGENESKEISLAVDFCGVSCENPFFLGSSVISSSYDMCAKALGMGWGGVVYKTIGFLPIHEASPRFDAVSRDGSEFFGFRNWEQISQKTPEEDFDSIKRLKRDFPSKVIIASIMGGIETWRDAAEFIALGCANVQITTAVMQYGYRIIDCLTSGLKSYLANENLALADLLGRANIVPAMSESIDRCTHIFPIFDKALCAGCGRCHISCSNAGHQAISFENRAPKVDGKKCEGCMLCSLVCPLGAISKSKRIRNML